MAPNKKRATFSDDLETKEALADIIHAARDTRKEFIQKMHELKDLSD